MRLTTSELGATGGVGFVTSTYEPSWYWNTLDLRQPPAQRAIKPGAAPFGARADRLWSVWRRAGSATTLGPTLYYKAFRPGLQLITPLRGTTAGGNLYTFTIASADGKSSVPALQDADEQDGVLWFRQEDEGRKVSVIRRDLAGGQVTETHYIGWREEGSEAPVPMDVSVGEGAVSAFPTIDLWNFVPVNSAQPQGAQAQLLPHLENLWLFWTSTRGAGSDIFHATIAPRLTPLPG